jgi:hypothetical protein
MIKISIDKKDNYQMTLKKYININEILPAYNKKDIVYLISSNIRLHSSTNFDFHKYIIIDTINNYSKIDSLCNCGVCGYKFYHTFNNLQLINKIKHYQIISYKHSGWVENKYLYSQKFINIIKTINE